VGCEALPGAPLAPAPSTLLPPASALIARVVCATSVDAADAGAAARAFTCKTIVCGPRPFREANSIPSRNRKSKT
jgi:hypothetical protein